MNIKLGLEVWTSFVESNPTMVYSDLSLRLKKKNPGWVASAAKFVCKEIYICKTRIIFHNRHNKLFIEI